MTTTQPNTTTVIEPSTPAQASLYQQLRGHLAALKLHTAAEALPSVLDHAAAEKLSLTAALERLLALEVEATEARRLAGRLRFASLPTPATLEEFDYDAQPAADHALIQELATCRYLESATNVLLIGPPGTGKTHLAVGLARKAAEAGYRTYFTSAADLAARCHRAAIEGRWAYTMRFFAGPTLLVIDLCRHRDYADLGPLNAGQRRRRGWIHRHNPSAPRNARTWTDNSQRPGLGSPASVLRFDGRVNAQLEPGGQTRLWTITRLLVTHHPRPHLLRVPGGNCGDYAEQFGPATPLTSTDRTEVGIVAVSA